MLIEPMIQQLQQLRLRGMAAALEQLLANTQHQNLSFEERMSLMIQHEITERDSKRLAQRLRWAKLRCSKIWTRVLRADWIPSSSRCSLRSPGSRTSSTC